MAKISVSVVVPAYNEELGVSQVVAGLKRFLEPLTSRLEVIVVDDGSTDGTAKAAARAGATVLRHPFNRGYGKALRTGFSAAQHDWILTIDADGSYPPAEAAKLLEHAPACDLIIGTRTGVHFWGSAAQALRRLIYLKLAGFIVGGRVPDANSGLRLVRRSLVVRPGAIECLGYSFSTTMTLSFLNAGHFVMFTPVAFEARRGCSKVKPLRDVLRTLQLMTEVFLFYNPLKFFVTLTAGLTAFALFLVIIGLGRDEGIWLIWAGFGAFAAVICFLTGCVLDAMRMHGRRPPEP
jgi:glycosyltransferase involved in cell wall biosynthesis